MRGGGKSTSTVSLNASSSILGIKLFNNFELSSKQGFVFTSINQVLKSESNIKSYPKISKQYFLFSWFINFLTDKTDFIIKQGTNADAAIQVVYDTEDEKTLKREINGLVQCSKEIHPKESLVITKDKKGKETIDGIKIRFVPIIEWLLNP